MSMTLTNDAISRALAREMANACAAALGATAALAPSEGVDGAGWIVTVPFSGAATGHMLAWIDAASASAYTRRTRALETDPDDDSVSSAIGALVARAAAVVETSPEGAGLIASDPAPRRAPAPDASDRFSASFEDGLAIGFRVSVNLEAGAPTVAASAPAPTHGLADSRLEAVLEVDLPLIVRFGRAVMPLRNVAELSPGAVVDMGRTPDEPVELLVGERLVARGEVVIVGGNYGVRITELTSGRRSTDVEARI